MTAKAPKAKQPTRPRGKPAHQPTAQTIATVRAMVGVGYPHVVIARNIGISDVTLRLHYREVIDHAVEQMCAMVFANLHKISTTKNDNAGVQAGRYILACRAGWKETSRRL
jgi:hypothetical protein